MAIDTVRSSLVVVAVYDTMYATWRAQATWSRLGRYAPTHARIPTDEQFGLGLLGGTRVPCPPSKSTTWWDAYSGGGCWHAAARPPTSGLRNGQGWNCC
jgi:hypothetical protein